MIEQDEGQIWWVKSSHNHLMKLLITKIDREVVTYLPETDGCSMAFGSPQAVSSLIQDFKWIQRQYDEEK